MPAGSLGRRFKPRRRHTPSVAETMAAENARADRLLTHIRHWLLAMEKYHNINKAPKRPFSSTHCTGDGSKHWNHIKINKRGDRATHLTVAAPRDNYPAEVLGRRVIALLKEEGFEISEGTNRSCGCFIFTARPRKLAG